MKPENVLVDLRDGIATLTLNRPEKRNALDAKTREDLIAVLDELRDDPACRVVIVTGAGDRAFAAGADLNELEERDTWQQRDFIRPPHVYQAIREYPKPVIAVVNGLALGAGCELMMACDYRLASHRAKVGQPEINLGIIPGGGGTQRLPRLVGPGRAARLVYTGEIVDAATAHAWGLVDEVVPAVVLQERARDLAKQMADKSPLALRLAKEALRAAENLPLEKGLEREIDLFTLAFQSEDKREGVRAFFEKRKPEWKGR